MSALFAKLSLLGVALISIAVVIAHLSCIFLGPSCFELQMAPQVIVDSARDGTWLAPLATLFISCLFLICAAYALSSAAWLLRLPLLNLLVHLIGLVCVIRALVVTLESLIYPQYLSLANTLVSGVWLLCALGLVVGHRKLNGPWH